MAHRFIHDLPAGETVDDQVFLIRSKDLRTTAQGNLYIHAILVDRTGEIVARLWQATEAMFKAMPEGGFMRFKGRTQDYKGSVQFIIEAIRVADPGTFELADFLPTTTRDIKKMWGRVVEIVGEIKHPQLAALVKEFLADEELMERFRKAPAAAALHHAYIGGLLEHTLNVLELALRTIPLYPKLSLDLTLTGVFLHDIGKTAELAYDTAIGYSDGGQLVGHIALAAIWIEQKAKAIGDKTGTPFPEPLYRALQHIILSHHGRYEFGSPKLPAIPEAVAIHYLDNFDAKVYMFLAEIDNDRDADSHWTNYNRALETRIYKPDLTGSRADQT